MRTISIPEKHFKFYDASNAFYIIKSIVVIMLHYFWNRAEHKEQNETERTKRFEKERNGWERNTLHLTLHLRRNDKNNFEIKQKLNEKI